ncbi:MAG TPA: BTAD domain-containing putative transcriptional regulator [Acidimicrobiia bacterium]|jgi:DNA-binding SARP family transcriptional activator|nr:BTAD domain-containing putative transcriptional regulator [Acidimicrobiia bacterium]
MPMQVSVLGGFDFAVADGSRPPLAAGARRLLAYLALRVEPVSRRTAAGSLWPDADDERAAASLRTALSRLDSGARDALAVEHGTLGLASDVVVDFRASQSLARRLLADDERATDLDPDAVAALSCDVLPDWYDEWVVPDAEEWRQLRVAALEALAARLLATGRFAHAMLAAVSAVHVEPLRERANATVIRVHLAEGNRADALCEFRRYRALVQRELGVEPTDTLYELVGVSPAATRRRGDGHVPTPKWDEVRDVHARVADLRGTSSRGKESAREASGAASAREAGIPPRSECDQES